MFLKDYDRRSTFYIANYVKKVLFSIPSLPISYNSMRLCG